MRNTLKIDSFVLTATVLIIIGVLSCNAKKTRQGDDLRPTLVLDIPKEPVPYKTVPLDFNRDSLYLGMWSYEDQYLKPCIVNEYYIKGDYFYILSHSIDDLVITRSGLDKIPLSEIKISNIGGNYFWHGNLPTGDDIYYSISAYDSAIQVYAPDGKYRKYSAQKIHYLTESIEKYKAYNEYCIKNDSNTIIRWYCGYIRCLYYKKGEKYYTMDYSDDNTPEISRVKPVIRDSFVILKKVGENKTGRDCAFKINDSSQLYVITHDKSEHNFVTCWERIYKEEYLYNTLVDSFYFGSGFKWK